MPIDVLVQQVRSQCCDKIQNLYSKIQLLNLQQIDVDQLYVDVYLLKTISSVIPTTIPGLLKNSDLRNDVDRFGLGERGDRNDGFEVANDHRRLMILGKPGSGKTTFLRHLAVACCQGEFQSEHIPILIELRSIKNASHFNLLNIIHQEFDLPNQEQTKEILKQGKALILLDGLDEVPSESQRDVQKEIEQFSQEYYNNRYILTCRTQTTEYNLQTFNYVEVADFNTSQVGKFAEKWFTTLAKTPQHGQELTARFLEKIKLPKNKQIADLAVTPILLSLTCWIFGESEDLPSKRSELYKRGIALLLEKWDENRNIRRDLGSERYRKLSPEDKQKLLSYVAYRKFTQEQYALFEESEVQKYIAGYLEDISTNDSKAVLKAIEAQHGLLIERAQYIYSFSHLTFQEYFTAQYIVENEQVEQLVKGHLTDTRWRKVFLLAAELMGNDADNLLSLMQKEAQNYIIDTPKLQALLRWADDITSGTAGNIAPIGKRAIAIAIANAIANAYEDTNAYDMMLAIAFANFNVNAISDAYDHANFDVIAIVIADAYANSNTINEVIEDIRKLEKLQIFNYEEFTKLAVNLEKLRFEIPNNEDIQEQHTKWAEELRTTLLNAFNLTPEMIDLSKAELETLDDKYLYANKLILNCKNAAVSDASPGWWQEIEERMLKPNL